EYVIMIGVDGVPEGDIAINIENIDYSEPINNGVAVFRSEECTGCKVCISHCPNKAIILNDAINQVEINEDLCDQCEDCHYRCPVIKFGHNEIEDLLQGLK
ncbi:MAG: 4Fe-4S dicluster domain-containing protein, partial [Candidatus Thorarchaeota archaeon]